MGRRCLVVGASGQLGRALCAAFRASHEVFETTSRSPDPGQWRIDLGDPATVVATLEAVQPEWILIAGVIGNVDRAETEREFCVRVNVDGPRAIAEYARKHSSVVVYFSTDTVFDGAKERYTESDPVSPLNVYSQSKVQGEVVMRLGEAAVWGDDRSHFNGPSGVAIAANGDIWVADGHRGGNNRIVKLTSDGTFVLAVGGGVGSESREPGRFSDAHDLKIDS